MKYQKQRAATEDGIPAIVAAPLLLLAVIAAGLIYLATWPLRIMFD